MWKFTDVNCEHLATFRSEWIGVQYYYFCTMKIDNRTIRFSFMFDAEDLCTHLDADTFTDEELDDYADEMAWCYAETLASLPSMNEIIQSANKSIQEYNNGARFQIADNYDMEDMADAVTQNIDKADILHIKKLAEGNATSFLDEGETIYWQIDEVVENYCSDHELFVVDTNDVIELIK